MWMTIAVTAVLLYLTWYLWWKLHHAHKRIIIPGPRGWPLIGNAFDVPVNRLHIYCTRLAQMFGPIFKLNIFGGSMIVLSDADLVRRAFAEEPYLRFLNDRPTFFAGKSILHQDESGSLIYNPLYVKCRKILHTALHMYGKGLESFEEKVSTELGNLAPKLSTEDLGEEQLPLDKIIHRSLINVMTILLCGHPILKEAHFTALQDFDRYTNELFQPGTDGVLSTLPFLRHLPGKYGDLYRGTCRTKDLLGKVFFYDLKKTYRRDVERGIIDVFLRIQEDSVAEGETWCTDILLLCLVLNLYLAGILTSQSSILSYIFIMLHHKDVQSKVQAEIDGVIGQRRKPSIKDRSSMPYTEATIFETLRYVSQNPFGLPHKCNTDVNFDGYYIPKSSTVFANLWYIHHDEKIWGDPWNFRPDRFLDVEGNLLPADNNLRQKLMAFGIGRRQCPGESFARARVFLYVTTLLQNFTFLPADDRILPPCDPRDFKVGAMLMPPEFKYIAKRRKAN